MKDLRHIKLISVKQSRPASAGNNARSGGKAGEKGEIRMKYKSEEKGMIGDVEEEED